MRPLLSLLILLSLALNIVARAEKPLAPDKPIDLLKLESKQNFTPFLNPKVSLETDPAKAFHRLDDGTLRIAGNGWGYLRTNDSFKDYHLVLEYKWGEHTWRNRAGKARDSGILFHGQLPDGGFGNSWIPSFEAQLIEGGSGNLAVVGATDNPTHTLTATHPLPSQEHGRKAAADYVDPNWTDTQGYRGKNDLEVPVGDWNRIEVIARDDKITVLLNGKEVNRANALSPSSGHIALQSEGAEIFVRRFELHPLDSFKESWQPDPPTSQTGTGLLPRPLPLSPEDSLATIEIDGPWQLELVAAEPLVTDPVDVAFDEQGRIYVAEMRDYPGIPEHGPLLSRIRLLTDTDNDGKIDTSTVWAGELDHPQGLCRMNGGFLVTTRNAILFLKDTDGDDVADHREILFHPNDPRHTQLSVSSPRWGPDNTIYLNNGLDGKEIYPHGQPDSKLTVTNRNFRFNPYTTDPAKRLTPVTGRGQFGGTFDDWGRHFFCSNRNPTMFAVMPLGAMNRNPYYPIAQGHEDIAPSGGQAKVYPLTLTHTTAAFHAGTYTAACGLAVYRGDLIPELKGNLFVCEPPGQLVTRSQINPNGASLKAERVGDHKDLIASTDEWFRPVNLRNGPDGALYLCDMQRRFIDHARFFPDAFALDNYMRSGFDHGRLYRLVPRNKKAVPQPTDRPLPEELSELVPLLAHPNAWHRIHARRLLMEQREQIDASLSKVPLDWPQETPGFNSEWWAGLLESKGFTSTLTPPYSALSDEQLEGLLRFRLFDGGSEFLSDGGLLPLINHKNPRIAFLAICHAETLNSPELIAATADALIEHPTDPWLQKAALSASADSSTDLLLALLPKAVPHHADLVRDLTMVTAARGHIADVNRLLASFTDTPGWIRFASLKGLSEGLRKTKGKLKGKSLASLLKSPPAQLEPHIPAMRETLKRARTIAVDPGQDINARLAAIPLLESLSLKEALLAFDQLLAKKQPPSIQQAAFALMPRFNRTGVAPWLLEKWPTLAPVAQTEALAFLSANATSAKALLNKMKAGDIPASLLDLEKRWRYSRSTDAELKALAAELFGSPSADRAAILADYQDALTLPGNADKGHHIFVTNCSACHKIDGEGVDVAPDISDVRIKPPEAILSDILDPNRIVESRWSAVAVETNDGLALTGIIDSESPDTLTVKMQGGLTQSIPRQDIKNLTPLNQSLMPVGLEAVLNKQQMAHLIAFLKKR